MCYHIIQDKLASQIEKRFDAKIKDDPEFASHDHFNGFLFPKTPVITNDNPKIIQHFNWGLIPHWSKDKDIRALTLNAKIETLDEKPSFRDVVNQRCLVIANGYFEWQWLDLKGKNKVKYKLSIANEDLFAFAGLYSRWINSHTGEIRNTYTIVTTEANALMSKIHNNKKRMPVILKPQDEERWLKQTPLEQFAFPYSVDLKATKILPDTEALLLFQ